MAPEDMTPTSSAAAGKQDRPKRKTPTPTSSADTPSTSTANSEKKNAKTTAAASSAGGWTTLVVIEYCKESKSFKKKAKRLRKGLEKVIPGVNVVVNPETPRKGFFEIRDENDEPLLTLMDMNRVLKSLDVDNLVSDIVDYIKRFGRNNW